MTSAAINPNSMRIPIIVSLLILATSASAHAQTTDSSRITRRVTGQVTDSLTGRPLAGATIRVYVRTESPDGGTWLEPTGEGAIADADGRFVVVTPLTEETILQATYVGYGVVRLHASGSVVDLRMGPTAAQRVPISVSGIRRSRSVEDACCRVESIREEVQQHAPFSHGVDQVLRRYSSCTSTRISCSIDGAGFIRLRGLEPTAVRVLFDGAPVFGGLSTFYGLSMIPPHALQTITITEGASSAAYGNGAVSGVVDLQMRPPTEEGEFQGSVSLHGMEEMFEGVGVNLGWTGMIDQTGIAAFASTTLSPEHAGEESAPTTRKGSLLARGNVMLDDATELIATLLGGTEHRRGEARGDAQGEFPFVEELNLKRGDLALKLSRSLSELSTIDLSLHGGLFTMEGSFGATSLSARQTTSYARLSWSGEPATALRSMLGIERFTDMLKERTFGEIDYDVAIASVFAQNEWEIAPRWGILASLRYDHHSGPGGIFSPRGALRWSPSDNVTMRVMAGAGFKGEALFNEDHATLHRNVVWRANPGYDFERSFTLNYDISYDVSIDSRMKVETNFNAYRTELRNTPTPQPDSLEQGALFMVNSSRPSFLQGIELQTRWSMMGLWSGSIAIAGIDYHRELEDGSTSRVPLAPTVNIDISIMYHDDQTGWTVEGWGSHVGAQTLPENPWGRSTSPPYSLVNGRIEKSLGAVSLFAGVLNILDAEQLDITPLSIDRGNGERSGGIVWGPMEGRELFIGVKWTPLSMRVEN